MAAREAALNQPVPAGFGDDLVCKACDETPGVDDTPYIQYALEAITKEPSEYTPHTSDDSYSFPSPCAGYGVITTAPQQRRAVQPPKPHVPQPLVPQPLIPRQMVASDAKTHVAGGHEAPAPPQSQSTSPGGTVVPEPRVTGDELPERHAWTPVEPWHRPHVLPLRYKPLLLRPVVVLGAAMLSVVMIALVIFSATYSKRNYGLLAYSGSIHGVHWFLFRILPQTLALLILLLAQAIVSTVYRMLPFRMLASDSEPVRHGALVRDMHFKSFILPTMDGSWDISIPVVLVWLCHFAIPLQSSLFSVIFVDGTWRWATVRGVAWALVGLYFLLSSVFIFIFFAWRHAETGLLWDPTSLADVVSLFSRTNNITAFDNLDGPASKSLFRYKLGAASDRLAWWHDRSQPRPARWWYSLGLSGNSPSMRGGMHGKKTKYLSSNDTLQDEKGGIEIGDWYLPCPLRTGSLLIFVFIAVVLLVVIFVLSFIETTKLANGFLPGVEAAPRSGAFSAANFLWSFFPSFLGLVLWLFWQGLENYMRILAPWAELNRPDGTDAKHSILLDYAAAPFPLIVTFNAVKNGHWRMAALSLLSAAFAFLPVLGGGLFMALTDQDDQVVRMFTNFPVYGVLLGSLVLYAVGLTSLIPDRKRLRLPHAVDSLAEVFSFCTNNEFLADLAFRTAGDFDYSGQYTPREKRRMMVEDLIKGGGEKRFAFLREGGRWAICRFKKFTGEESLGMARRMRDQFRTRALRGEEYWGQRGSDLPGRDDSDTE